MKRFGIPRSTSGARPIGGVGKQARRLPPLRLWIAAGLVWGACLPGHAAINALTLHNSYDGTAGWDTAPGNGLDMGPNNGIVRTNDQFEYLATFGTDGGGDNDVTLVSTLPLNTVAPRVGQPVARWSHLPASCTGAGSGISPDGQTLTCNVGNVVASGTQSVYLTATVLSSTPNGTSLPAPSLSASSSATISITPTATPTALTVTAAPFYDVVVQMSSQGNPRAYGFMPGGGPVGEDGFFHRPLVGLVAKNPNGNGNKGVEQLDPAVPVHFNMDVSGYPSSVRLDNWHPSATGTFATGCGSPSNGAPAAASGGSVNMHAMVSDAGGSASIASTVVPNGGVCANATQTGTTISFDVTGIDTTLQRRPTTFGNSGSPVPASEWWVSNKALVLWTPLSYYPPGENVSHEVKLGSVTGQSISGQSIIDHDKTNNSVGYPLRTLDSGNASKLFTADNSLAVPLATQCDPTVVGDCHTNHMTPTQTVRSRIIYANTGTATHYNAYLCEIIDRTAFDIGANFGVSTYWTNVAVNPPAATMLYGARAAGTSRYFASTDTSPDPYSNAGVGTSAYATARCNDSTIQWFSTAAQAEAAGGLVYVRADLPEVPGGASAGMYVRGLILRDTWAATINVLSPNATTRVVGQRIPEGTILRNEGDIGSPLAGMNGAQIRDHLQVVRIRTTSRVSKRVVSPADAATVPQRVGSTLTYELQPRYSTYFPQVAGTYTVTDVLPPNLIYVGNTATVGGSPREPMVSVNTPAPGYTTLVWTLANQTPYLGADGPAANLAPIRFDATIALQAPNSAVLVNAAAVSGGSSDYHRDCSYDTVTGGFGACLKAAIAQVSVQTPPGFQVQKTTLVPQIEPGQSFGYRVTYVSFGGDVAPPNIPDFIDILPFVGDGTASPGRSFAARTPPSAFDPGAYHLVSVTLPSNDPGMTVFYTLAAPNSIHNDPRDASNNMPGGSTRWCTATQLGTAGCPATIGESTAVRIRPGVGRLAANTPYRVDITFGSDTNIAKHGDVFSNSVGGRSPDPASRLVFVSSRANTGVQVTAGASVTGMVFRDDNDDGAHAAGEPGIGGVTMTLHGCVAGPDATLNTTGIADTGAPVCAGDDAPITRTVTTGPDGVYRFDGLPSGLYRITQTQPAGYLDGKRQVGSAGGTANAQGAMPSVITNIALGMNVPATGYNFGELRNSGVSVTKLSDPASGTNVAAEQTITYTVRVTVADTATRHVVTLTDTLGAGLELVPGSLPAGGACTGAAQVITCTLAAGAAVGDHDFTYQAKVAKGASGSVNNSVVPSGGDNPACSRADACSTTHPLGSGGAPTPVPVNAPWALMMLSVLVGWLARRRRHG